MKTVTLTGAGGLRLVASELGADAALPVVLLHGGGQTRHAWTGTASALAAAGYRCLALDLRGHGDSAWPDDGDYTAEAFADDMRSVAAYLGRPAVGVGASLGGLVLLGTAGAVVDLLAGLVLVDIAPKMEPQGVDRIVTFMTARPDGFLTLDEAADAIAAYLPHRERPRDLRGLAKNLRQRPDGRYVWHWDPRLLAPSNFAGDRDTERLRTAARSVRVPTLLVRGALSDLLSDDGVDDFRGLVPHTEYEDVRGAHHMVVGDRNDAFTGAVVAFLERHFRRSDG